MHNDKITLILTLKDNIEFTYRWLNYMNNQKCKYKILIADGGSNDSVEKILADRNLYANLNYEYIRYPYDKNLKIYYKKLLDVVNLVKTPYILFMDNDDFFILDSIPIFIDYLDRNKDTVSCGGNTASLSLYSDRNKLLNETVGDGYTLSRPINNSKSIQSNDSTARVCDFFNRADTSCLWLNYYFIHKASAVKDTLNFLSEYQFKDVVSLEIYIQMSFNVIGKTKELDYPYYIRQEETSTFSKSENKVGNIIVRFLNNNISSEIRNSIEHIGEKLSLNEKDAIFDRFSSWFILHGSIIYANPTKNKFKEFFESQNNLMLYIIFLRLSSFIKNFFSNTKVKYFVMKDLEKHILIGKKEKYK